MKVVILCGGKGTRLREETEYRPKPMLPIGNRPILWHIMKIYAAFGFKEFILCLGYKGEMIKDFFRNYLWMTSHVTLRLGLEADVTFHNHHDEEDWTVTLADTGEETLTAGRIRRIKQFIGNDPEFFLTYGDGVGNIDIAAALAFHREHGKHLTVTAVHPPGRFGELAIGPGGIVREFNEKPQVAEGRINGGFFVASRAIFDYLDESADNLMFEVKPMQNIARQGQLMAFAHDGFWQPMDTYSEYSFLNRLWAEGACPVENLEAMTLFGSAFEGKRVLVTGHTGFKGSWLCEWLLGLGAQVTGLSLPPQTEPSLFVELGLARRLRHIIGDIQDPNVLTRALTESKPDFVFHLAAQALVRQSYLRPRETFNVNAMGTLHLLEALRRVKKPCAALFITTDKCYENREWHHGYREVDPLGGRDPYSASKAAAELIIACYRDSFFQNHPVKIASTRLGTSSAAATGQRTEFFRNCITALRKNKSIPVRNRRATRPWQHVLEPLSGYLWLAASLADPKLRHCDLPLLTSAFNFGPARDANRTVEDLVKEILKHWPGRWQDKSDPRAPHEAGLLQLSTDKAHALLQWFSIWSFSEAVALTVDWYRNAQEFADAREFQELTQSQISQYVQRAAALCAPWVEIP